MKICLSASGKNKDSLVNPRFGRCPYFAVWDGQNLDFIENKAVQMARGAGVAAAQKVSDLGCQVVISGNIGPHAFYALKSMGIKVFAGVLGKTINETLKDYQEGKLKEIQSAPRGFGFSHRHGRGFK